jgi:hypothetical protein
VHEHARPPATEEEAEDSGGRFAPAEADSDDSVERLRAKYTAEAARVDRGRRVTEAELDGILERFSSASDPFVES